MKYAGADWLKQHHKISKVSSFGEKVADILGQVEQGIYHIDSSVLSRKVDWASKKSISVSLYQEMATFDFPRLTLLLFCSLHSQVSVSISGAMKGYTRITFENAESGLDWLSLNTEKMGVEAFANRLKTKTSKPLWRYSDAGDDITKGCSYSRVGMSMQELCEAVAIAHASAIRFSVQGRSRQSIEFALHQRTHDNSLSTFARHPNMVEAIELLRPYWQALDQKVAV